MLADRFGPEAVGEAVDSEALAPDERPPADGTTGDPDAGLFGSARVSGAEALALLQGVTPGPWQATGREEAEEYYGDWRHAGPALLFAGETPEDDDDVAALADSRLIAAAPDLAAAVAHHAARADRAEAEVAALRAQLDEAMAKLAAVEAELRRLPGRDGDALAAAAAERACAAMLVDAATRALEGAAHVAAERDRLARALAVELGDQTQAPAGWRGPYGTWARDGELIQRFVSGSTVRWERRGIRRDDPRHREWSTALEAMEAIDAEVAGDVEVSDG
jgi:hypothetical protein